MLTPETTNASIMFLIQAGSLAATELRERWKARRNKEIASINLNEKTAVEADAPKLLERLLGELSPQQLDKIRNLIEEKEERIYHWKRSKVLAKKEFDLGRIPLDVLIAKEEDLDNRIATMLGEIKEDMLLLGLVIDEEPI